jgi:uncharacterized membrane protein AbrB (regulator of aidB expression)
MSDPKKTNDTLRYAGLATQWMVMLLIAVWGGYKLDKVTAWKFPVFLILFPLISLAILLWGVIKEFTKPKK